MATSYMTLGPSPLNEMCVQLGKENYKEKALKECQRYVQLLESVFQERPDGVYFQVKTFSHDFGDYLEVVIVFDTDRPDQISYAYDVQANLPQEWDPFVDKVL